MLKYKIYSLLFAAAGFFRLDRVRLRFGFVAAASLLSASLLLDVGFTGVVLAVFVAAFVGGLVRPWSVIASFSRRSPLLLAVAGFDFVVLADGLCDRRRAVRVSLAACRLVRGA